MKELICAVMTKFDESGKLVLDERYAEFLRALLDGGVDSIMVAGTNGEFHVMDVSERKALLEFVLESAGEDTEIIAHIGTSNLKDTVSLGEHALSLGVKKLSVVAPYYFKYDSRALVEYFVEVANSLSEAEIILYNIPSFTGNRLELSHIASIKSKAPNVIGLKDSDMRPWIVPKIKKELGEDFIVFGGLDTVVIDYLAMGSDGQVSGTSNVFPKILRRILDEFDAGNYESSFELQKKLQEIVERVSGHVAFVGANKHALRYLGYDLGYPRRPSRPLQDSEMEEVKSFVEEVREWAI